MAETADFIAGGVTPRKLLLVAVLAVTLLAVLIYQFGYNQALPIEPRSLVAPPVLGSSSNLDQAERQDKPNYDDSRSTSSLSSNQDTPHNDHREIDKRITDIDWPEIRLGEILQHNPFQPHISLLPVSKEQISVTSPRKKVHTADPDQILSRVATLRQQGVQLILISEKDRVAKIGNLTVHVGDVLNGLRVIDIHPDGITLTRAETGPD